MIKLLIEANVPTFRAGELRDVLRGLGDQRQPAEVGLGAAGEARNTNQKEG